LRRIAGCDIQVDGLGARRQYCATLELTCGKATQNLGPLLEGEGGVGGRDDAALGKSENLAQFAA
jgi:hypothetical protein